MTPKTLSAAAAAVVFAFLSLGATTPAQAAPHAFVVIHTGAHAQGHPAYQPAYQPVYQSGHWPGHRPEAVPRPRSGHHWVSGHWQQRGRHTVWQPGHWERSRPAYRPGYGAVHHPSPPGRPNGHYAQPRPPRWDRDGDGVPNRHDQRPNNPYRY